MNALRQDPVLAGVKLIAEPWDIGPGGYQLGNFPPGFAEWNDRYRDTLRRFWRGDSHAGQDMGWALLGSAGVFDRQGRRVWSSINYAASHDGFTLADTTRYIERHNEANGEDNADGHHANFSDNFGIEGESEDAEIRALRLRRLRNLLATVLLSQGTPMLLAGDEGGHSQKGNNNTYCQDNALSWLDWSAMEDELVEFTAHLSALRRAHPVLRQATFLHGARRASDGQPDVEWRGFKGGPLNWSDTGLGCLCLHLRGSAETAGEALSDEVILAINREDGARRLTLPKGRWVRQVDTSEARQTTTAISGAYVTVAGHSLSAFRLA